MSASASLHCLFKEQMSASLNISIYLQSTARDRLWHSEPLDTDKTPLALRQWSKTFWIKKTQNVCEQHRSFWPLCIFLFPSIINMDKCFCLVHFFVSFSAHRGHLAPFLINVYFLLSFCIFCVASAPLMHFILLRGCLLSQLLQSWHCLEADSTLIIFIQLVALLMIWITGHYFAGSKLSTWNCLAASLRRHVLEEKVCSWC